ncbi:MAG TPA: hypothetical protein VEN30_00150 [Paraburkholderia sp.]|nr:hypothetical protein [Paraburkholderia sp.]
MRKDLHLPHRAPAAFSPAYRPRRSIFQGFKPTDSLPITGEQKRHYDTGREYSECRRGILPPHSQTTFLHPDSMRIAAAIIDKARVRKTSDCASLLPTRLLGHQPQQIVELSQRHAFNRHRFTKRILGSGRNGSRIDCDAAVIKT